MRVSQGNFEVSKIRFDASPQDVPQSLLETKGCNLGRSRRVGSLALLKDLSYSQEEVEEENLRIVEEHVQVLDSGMDSPSKLETG